LKIGRYINSSRIISAVIAVNFFAFHFSGLVGGFTGNIFVAAGIIFLLNAIFNVVPSLSFLRLSKKQGHRKI
jgi:hypothetical protein